MLVLDRRGTLQSKGESRGALNWVSSPLLPQALLYWVPDPWCLQIKQLKSNNHSLFLVAQCRWPSASAPFIPSSTTQPWPLNFTFCPPKYSCFHHVFHSFLLQDDSTVMCKCHDLHLFSPKYPLLCLTWRSLGEWERKPWSSESWFTFCY